MIHARKPNFLSLHSGRNMAGVKWNINALVGFISLGGLFFGMDTDKIPGPPP
jgi:hypothetical protein